MKPYVETKDGSVQKLLNFDDLHDSFQFTSAYNDYPQIEFTAKYCEEYKHAFDLLQPENVIIYQGQPFIIKQVNPISEAKVTTNQVTAVHKMRDLLNNIRPDEFKPTDNTPIVRSFQDAVNYYLNGNDQGVTAEFNGNFNSQTISSLGGDSLESFLSSNLNAYTATMTFDNSHIKFYTVDAFKNNVNRTFRWLGNSDDVELNYDTTSITNSVVALGKEPDNDDNGNPIGTQLKITYTDQNSVNQWGLHRGTTVSNDIITDANALQAYAATQIQPQPETTMQLNFYDDDVINQGDQWHIIIDKGGFETDAIITGVQSNEFNNSTPSVITFNNSVKQMNDVNVALANKITAINVKTMNLDAMVKNSAKNSEDHFASLMITDADTIAKLNNLGGS